MSGALAREFFPAVYSIVQSQPWMQRLWTKLLPASVEELCPKPWVSLKALFHGAPSSEEWILMWPAASIFCALGIAIGFWHASYLLPRAMSGKGKRGELAWGCAFLWYGVMSVGGLMHHCVAPAALYYALDVASTGCCSLALVAACVGYAEGGTATAAENRRAAAVAGAAYAAAWAITVTGPQLAREVLYLVPAGMAFACGMWRAAACLAASLSRWRDGGAVAGCLAWTLLACFFGVVALASVLVDPWLCKSFGANFSLLCCFFLGCDGAILCLFRACAAAQATAYARATPPQKSHLQ